MTSLPDRFRAFLATKHDDRVDRGIVDFAAADLPAGEVTIRVAYSSLNYKDALAVAPKGRVALISPLIPGVDLAGTVVASDSPDVSAGAEIIVHGYDLGAAHHGGLAEYARVPAAWVVPLPAGLTARQAMALGTAGYTAALSVAKLEDHGMRPADGPVLVLGASGGVGSTAVGILGRRGYEVHASTGKAEEAGFLRDLGAAEVLSRDDVAPGRPLQSERWAGCVDPVGGGPLAYALSTLRISAAAACSGLTAGVELQTTVFPFILRGVALLGIDSVNTPLDERRAIWERLATDLRPTGLDDSITREIGLDEVDPQLDELLKGRGRGRTVVRLAGA